VPEVRGGDVVSVDPYEGMSMQNPRPRYGDDHSIQAGDPVRLQGTDLIGMVTATRSGEPIDPCHHRPIADYGTEVYVEWTNGVSDAGPAEWIDVSYLAPTTH
jgi:hypothetical protein